jgi:putative (di)nucleoside polyphosphate hydrolase
MNKLPYRPCVVGVFINSAGQLLVGERADAQGAFQFPQGGIETGESSDEAIIREIREELGVQAFEVIRKADRLFTYDFPADGFKHKITTTFRGQIQQWFLLKLAHEHLPDIAAATDKEFASVRWMTRADILERVIYWKREVYLEGLKSLLDP